MNQFKCRISDSAGKIRDELRFAPDSKSLVKQINDEKLFLISFREDKSSQKRRYSKKNILDFTDTLSLMLKSGLTVKDALKVAASSFGNSKAGLLVNSINSSLDKGISFPRAIDEMSEDFPPIYRGMVRIGDQTGSMENIFTQLSSYLNEEKKMREKLQGAMVYPALVLSVMLLAMLAVFFFIFPKIRETFATDTLDSVFNRFQLMMGIILIPLLLILLFVLIILISSRFSEKVRSFAHTILLNLPLIGNILLLRASLNLMFSLEVLTSSGYPMEAAIVESGSVLSNSRLKSSLSRIKEEIVRGEKLSSAFRNQPFFPERIAVWISVGEASGEVCQVFSQLRTFFQGELDKVTSRIMMLVEPALIVTVGIAMILFVVMFVVPIFGVFGAVL